MTNVTVLKKWQIFVEIYDFKENLMTEPKTEQNYAISLFQNYQFCTYKICYYTFLNIIFHNLFLNKLLPFK